MMRWPLRGRVASEVLMPELEILLRKIKRAKEEGRNRLYLMQDVEPETVLALRDMGYRVLQFYDQGYVDTIIGWKTDA